MYYSAWNTTSCFGNLYDEVVWSIFIFLAVSFLCAACSPRAPSRVLLIVGFTLLLAIPVAFLVELVVC